MMEKFILRPFWRIRGSVRRTWEQAFGKSEATLKTEAQWEDQMARIFEGDRIVMQDRTKHQSGTEWLAHLARERLKKRIKTH